MKYLSCILLSCALATFAPTFAGGEAIKDIPPAGYGHTGSTSMGYSNSSCCTNVETCSQSNCNASLCDAGNVIEMPAVGLYAPLLAPEKNNMSLAKSKANKKKAKHGKSKIPVTTKTLNR